MRGQECVWTAIAWDDVVARNPPTSVDENKREIVRLNKVVRQLEAILAEREIELAMRLPLPPLDLDFPPPPTHNVYPRDAASELDRMPDNLGSANETISHDDFPPAHTIRGDGGSQSYLDLSQPYAHALEPRTNWDVHARASTWPQPSSLGLPGPPSDPQPASLPPFCPEPETGPVASLEELSRLLEQQLPDIPVHSSVDLSQGFQSQLRCTNDVDVGGADWPTLETFVAPFV
ncbi:hypothetical protein JCM3766R1_005408 [Sporobolomyces carnicolor]